jgi:hypothetical protein
VEYDCSVRPFISHCAEAVFLARQAAEIDGMSLSASMSGLVRRHAWESQRPRLTAEQQRSADEQEEAHQQEDRRRDELWRSPSAIRWPRGPAGFLADLDRPGLL